MRKRLITPTRCAASAIVAQPRKAKQLGPPR